MILCKMYWHTIRGSDNASAAQRGSPSRITARVDNVGSDRIRRGSRDACDENDLSGRRPRVEGTRPKRCQVRRSSTLFVLP